MSDLFKLNNLSKEFCNESSSLINTIICYNVLGLLNGVSAYIVDCDREGVVKLRGFKKNDVRLVILLFDDESFMIILTSRLSFTNEVGL